MRFAGPAAQQSGEDPTDADPRCAQDSPSDVPQHQGYLA